MKKIRPVVWANAGEVLEAVLDNRNQISNCDIKIMADGGQGFFKVCMSVTTENYPETDTKKKRNEFWRRYCLYASMDISGIGNNIYFCQK